jgi:hypothetical protein
MRLVMQRRLDVVCGEIEEAREKWHKRKILTSPGGKAKTKNHRIRGREET